MDGLTKILLIFLIVVLVVSGLMLDYNNTNPRFEGPPSVGLPGENGMPYGWLCYPATPHNLKVNEEYMHWAQHDNSICEWR